MKEKVFPPGIEPGTFRVLGGCDNHYTTETTRQQLLAKWNIYAFLCSNPELKFYLTTNDTLNKKDMYMNNVSNF